jgi:CheY-like chemotaxis protein
MAITEERTAAASHADDSEAGPANAERAHELGALAYLTKPFDPPALASLVAGAVVCADMREQPSTPRRASAAAEFHRAA